MIFGRDDWSATGLERNRLGCRLQAGRLRSSYQSLQAGRLRSSHQSLQAGRLRSSHQSLQAGRLRSSHNRTRLTYTPRDRRDHAINVTNGSRNRLYKR
jgi:hypothetical protein